MFNFGAYNIPGHMKESIERYAKDHHCVGGFLQAVLENDLKEACGRADEGNQKLLFEYCRLLYNEVPSACWGSPDKVKEWLSWTDKEPCANCKELGIPVRIWMPPTGDTSREAQQLCDACTKEFDEAELKANEEADDEPE